MSTTISRTTCLISHQTDLSELDFIAQNIEFALRTKETRVHGILSPYSKTYEYTLEGLEKICKKLNSVYGLKSLIVDISVAGDYGVLNKIKSLNLTRNESGVFKTENEEINFLLLNKSLEDNKVNLMEDFLFWKSIDESKKSYDLLFLLPSLKNPALVEQLEVNSEVQWLFVEKSYAGKVFRNLKENTLFQAPFFGIVTV